MLALHNRPSDIDVFEFFLATQLGMTVDQLRDMGHDEYVRWAAYFKAKHAIEHQKAVT